jgi:3-hydroxyisobutyrate dehydrogenase
MTTVGLVGLGNMGRGMALSLLRSGFAVVGFDADPDICIRRSADGIEIVAGIGELCRSADVILLSLPNASHVEAVIGGADGILAHARPGLLVIDTTTSDPETTRRLAARMAEAGMAMLDAPVSGGPRGALAGTMTMVIGGEAADLSRAMPVLEAISARRVHVGPVGAGHVTKLVNNLLCAAHLLTAAEALRIIDGAGLDAKTVLQGINAGSGRSGVTEVNLPTWVLNGAFDSGFTMKLMRKDVGLAATLMQNLGLTLPISGSVAKIWADSVAVLADDADFNAMTAHPDLQASGGQP